jgi:hypothetical protein
MKKIIVLVPIYKAALDTLEYFSLKKSLAALRGREVLLVGPEGLDLTFYNSHFPDLPFRAYPAECFASIPGYNRLLMSGDFYRQYLDYEFMLILQTDAVVLKDDLDYWCAQPFDYVGAPWPDGYELFINGGRFGGDCGKHVKVYVGNGGLSLRRISKCISLVEEFEGEIIDFFNRTGSSEDLFFSFIGMVSQDFIIPNEIIASRFALELRPSYYLKVNGGHLPMGGHAWWKYEPDFWRAVLPDMPALPSS